MDRVGGLGPPASSRLRRMSLRGDEEPGARIGHGRGFVLPKNEDQVPGWIVDLSVVIMYGENQAPVQANKRGRCTCAPKPKSDRV